jgi:hypothetical protein
MKINFYVTENNQNEDLKNEIIDINNKLNLLNSKIDNKFNDLENKIESKFIILDHNLNEIKIILKSIEKNKI